MRILLVEDDPTTARSIELMLTHANYNVYRTDMGEEGIDLAKLYDYDLILLDLDLPDMHGMEVLRQIRMSRVDTPILILTGSDDTESKLRGFGFGADDYMTKPFNRDGSGGPYPGHYPSVERSQPVGDSYRRDDSEPGFEVG